MYKNSVKIPRVLNSVSDVSAKKLKRYSKTLKKALNLRVDSRTIRDLMHGKSVVIVLRNDLEVKRVQLVFSYMATSL